jgi:hypothetical protein
LMALQAGCILEFATANSLGAVDGSAMVVIKHPYAPDAAGQMFEATHAGSSNPMTSALLDQVLGGNFLSPDRGLLHICRAGRPGCTAAMPGRPVYHIDCFRIRSLSSITEAWAQRDQFPVVTLPALSDSAEKKDAAEPVVSRSDRRAARLLQTRYLALQLEKGTVSEGLASRALLAQATRAEHDDHPKKKRKRCRSASSHSGSSGSGEDDAGSKSLFRDAPARNSRSLIRTQAEDAPGQLYEGCCKEIARHLGDRVGATVTADDQQKWVTYLTGVFFGVHSPDKIGRRTTVELQTIARALDALGRGELPELADLLSQRFKALETSVVEGNWNLARRMELVPEQPAGLASYSERRDAARSEHLHLKLAASSKKKDG